MIVPNRRSPVGCHHTVTEPSVAAVDGGIRPWQIPVELATVRFTVRGSIPAGLRSQPDTRDATPSRELHRLIAPGCALELAQAPQENSMQFRGRNRKDVKRKVLTYWSSHSRDLGLTLREFLANCRMGPNEQTIVFIQPQS